MEQHKVKARRRTRPEVAAHVDERFKVVVDEGEPSSRTQFVVGTSPLSFDSVPPYLGQAQPSNELIDSSPRSSMIKPASAAILDMPASPALVTAGAPSAAPAPSEAPKAHKRGWLLLAPAILLGLGALVLALKLAVAPSASAIASAPTPAVQPEAPSEAAPIREAAAAPVREAAAAPVREAAAAPVEKTAEPAEDDDIEILEPEPPSSTRSASTQAPPRPRPVSPKPRPAKPEPSSPVIF